MAIEMSVSQKVGLTMGDVRRLVGSQEVRDLPDSEPVFGRVKMGGRMTRLEVRGKNAPASDGQE